MTRRSERELRNDVDGFSASGEYSVQDLMLAAVKQVYDSELTSGEQQLLDDPERHLSTSACRKAKSIEFNT